MKTVLQFILDILPFTLSALLFGGLLLEAQNLKKARTAALKPYYRFSRAMLIVSGIFWCLCVFLVCHGVSLINVPERKHEFYIALVMLVYFTYHLAMVATTKVYITDKFITKKTLFGTRTIAIKYIVKIKNLGFESRHLPNFPTYLIIDSRNKKMMLSHYIVGIERALRQFWKSVPNSGG